MEKERYEILIACSFLYSLSKESIQLEQVNGKSTNNIEHGSEPQLAGLACSKQPLT
jgi:hypothetical protein